MLQVDDLRASRRGANVDRLTLLLGCSTSSQRSRASIHVGNREEVIERSQKRESLSPEQRDRVEAMQRLFTAWMAEDPAYDRQTLTELEQRLAEDPFSLRITSNE